MPICSEGRVRMIPRSSIDGKASCRRGVSTGTYMNG